MTQIIITGLFVLMMTANAAALVRHWNLMRAMEIILTNLNETQKQFNELMEAEQREKQTKWAKP